MARQKDVTLSELQIALMRVLWQRGETSTADVAAEKGQRILLVFEDLREAQRHRACELLAAVDIVLDRQLAKGERRTQSEDHHRDQRGDEAADENDRAQALFAGSVHSNPPSLPVCVISASNRLPASRH